MKIVLMTNTFRPHVGGVARSVEAFMEEYRKQGHEVLVVAPEFPGRRTEEKHVVRIPALQNFNASDFSVVLPVPKGLSRTLQRFRPDIIHSQHPFLLGMTAIRAARSLNLPLVFTHHTRYEEYTHYVPGDSPLLRTFVIELATHYANLSDQVIAPSESIRELLLSRGVNTPVAVIPTGVKEENFAGGDGEAFRAQHGIPRDARVIGHMGRLSLEKNLEFLSNAVQDYMRDKPDTFFLVVGSGSDEALIRKKFTAAGMQRQLVMTGTLEGQALADAMNAMTLFAFASRTETQGMVLTEAMAAGLPLLALDAPGAREVLRDKVNGRLVMEQDPEAYRDALHWLCTRDDAQWRKLVANARATAQDYSMASCARKALECYSTLQRRSAEQRNREEKSWEQIMSRIRVEWDILKSLAAAGDEALNETNSRRWQ